MEVKYDILDRRKISEIGLTVISFVSIFLAITIFSFSTYLFIADVDRIDDHSIQLESQVKCTKLLTENGFRVTPIDSGLDVHRIVRNRHKENMYLFDSVSSRCKNYELTSFCFSPNRDCERNGLNATLKYRKPFIYRK